MKTSNYLILICIIFFAINCKKNNTEKEDAELISNQEINPNNFDSVLKCSYFDSRDGYYVTTDNGCFYKKNDNNFGNIITYLIPKKNVKFDIANDIDLNDYLLNLSIKDLKNEFEVYICLIPKKYLEKTPEGYFQKEKYEREFYTFNTNKWELINTKIIKNKNDEQEDLNYIDSYIKKLTPNKKISIIDKNWIGNYKVDFGGERMGEEFEGNIVFYLTKNNVYLNLNTSIFNSETGKIIRKIKKDNIAAKIIRSSVDTIEIQTLEEKRQYILYKENGGPDFGATGKDIIILNPGNDNYPLSKI